MSSGKLQLWSHVPLPDLDSGGHPTDTHPMSSGPSSETPALKNLPSGPQSATWTLYSRGVAS